MDNGISMVADILVFAPHGGDRPWSLIAEVPNVRDPVLPEEGDSYRHGARKYTVSERVFSYQSANAGDYKYGSKAVIQIFLK